MSAGVPTPHDVHSLHVDPTPHCPDATRPEGLGQDPGATHLADTSAPGDLAPDHPIAHTHDLPSDADHSHAQDHVTDEGPDRRLREPPCADPIPETAFLLGRGHHCEDPHLEGHYLGVEVHRHPETFREEDPLSLPTDSPQPQSGEDLAHSGDHKIRWEKREVTPLQITEETGLAEEGVLMINQTMQKCLEIDGAWIITIQTFRKRQVERRLIKKTFKLNQEEINLETKAMLFF